jgi:hypothetical protein
MSFTLQSTPVSNFKPSSMGQQLGHFIFGLSFHFIFSSSSFLDLLSDLERFEKNLTVLEN